MNLGMSRLPKAYSIDHEGLLLDIALVETSSLLIHEEIIPYKLYKLKASIERDGVQSAPIIVDRDTRVVLDGMHRTAIMKELGCRFTCVCLIDYFHPSIHVQKWCRVIPAPFSLENAESLLKELDLKLEPLNLVDSEAHEELVLRFRAKAYRVVTDGDDLVDVFKKCYMLERKLQEWGYEVEHCTESDAEDNIASGSYEATLYLPSVKKEQVIAIATERKILTPKATRHRLPARPVGVNVPLSLLRDIEISVDDANEKLAEILNTKKVTRYDPGAEWMNRKYDETLYVFSDT